MYYTFLFTAHANVTNTKNREAKGLKLISGHACKGTRAHKKRGVIFHKNANAKKNKTRER